MKSVLEQGFIGLDMPPLPDDIWRGIGHLQLTELDSPAYTSSTPSATLTVWLSPVTETVPYSATIPRYGIICGNNPVNFRDPLGLCGDGGSLDVNVIQNAIKGTEKWLEYIVQTIASDEYSLREYEAGLQLKGFKTAAYGGFGAQDRSSRPEYLNAALDRVESWWYMPGRFGTSVIAGGFAAAIDVATFRGTEQAARDWLTMHLLQEWGVGQMYLGELHKLEQQAIQQQRNKGK